MDEISHRKMLKREVRDAQKDVIQFLESDLYRRCTRPERFPGMNVKTSDEWMSPLDWHVRLERPDLDGDGPIQLNVIIFDPDGKEYARLEDVGGAHAVDQVLP